MKKATTSEVRTAKRELILTFSLKDIYQPLTKQLLLTQWNIILTCINDILNKETHNLCYQEIYSELTTLLLYEIPDEVITQLNNILLTFAKQTSIECNNLINTRDFFIYFNPIWERVVSRFNLIRKLLNRFEKKAYDNIQKNTVYLIFIDYFKQNTSRTIHNFFDCLITNINNEIIQLRQSIINKTMEYKDENISLFLEKIKLGIDLLYECGKYKDNFNSKFINSSSEFYKEISAHAIEKTPLEDYIAFVHLVFELENKIVTYHLNEMSLKVLINQLNNILLQDKSKEIFDCFYQSNTNNSSDNILIEKYDLMKSIYTLFKGIKCEEDIKKRFSDYITQCSNKIFEVYSKNFFDFFTNLLKFKNNIDSIIKLSFLNDEKLKNLGKDSLAKTINLKPNFIADSFSKYIDYVITSQITTEEAKKAIDDFMIVFKLLDAKDSFENFFISKLALRSLFNIKHNREWEKYLIEQFKKECGNVFVTKSEEMLNDIESSQLFSNQYLKYSFDNSDVFNYYALSTYSWPVSNIIIGNVNEVISKKEKMFTDYYIQKNQGKALTWHLPYCNCELIFRIGNDSYLVKANGVHASILIKFTRNTLSFKTSELMKKTKIDRANLLPFLKAISASGILIYNRENDSYAFNCNFKSKQADISLIDISIEETSIDEMEKVEERTMEDRKPVIDAYIIKLLKPKKQMKLDDLVVSVINSIKFTCDLQLINARINHLINNRYIVKDENDDQLIKYN